MLRMLYCWRVAAVVFVLLVLSAIAPAYCKDSSIPVFDTVEQAIIGRNNKGPYTLDWVNIDNDSIVVVVNGRILRKGQDYKVDSANGLIAFDSNVLEDVIVRVSYKIINGKSKRNTSQMSTPITFNVFNTGKTSVNLVGLRVQDPAKSNANSGTTFIGMDGEKSSAKSKFTSQFLVSQTEGTGASNEGSSMDRSLIKMGGETRVGDLKFTGYFTEVGEKFAGEKQYGVAAGNQAMNLAVQFAPADSKLQGSASMNTAKHTTGAKAGLSSSVMEQKLAYSNNGLNATLSHSTTDTTAAVTGAESSVDATNMTVNKQFGKTTNAAVSVQEKTVQNNSGTENTSTQELAVSTSALKNTTVQTKVTNIDSDIKGNQLNTITSVTSKPADKVSFTATHATTDAENGAANNTSVSVKVNPLQNLELQSTVTAKNTADSQTYQRHVSLASTPVKYVKFSASFAQNGVNENDDITKTATLEYTPLSTMKFTTGYKVAENGSQVLTVRDYTATTKLGNYISANAVYRDRDLRQSFIPDTKVVDIAISPFNYFSLVGSHQSNPEAKNGVVQNYDSTSAGLKFNIGSVDVAANFTTKDEYLNNKQTEERKLAFDLPAFGRGRINTSYNVARWLNGVETTANTFSLGYRQDVNSSFNVSFTGYYTRYMQDDISLGNDKYSAEANIGLKF